MIQSSIRIRVDEQKHEGGEQRVATSQKSGMSVGASAGQSAHDHLSRRAARAEAAQTRSSRSSRPPRSRSAICSSPAAASALSALSAQPRPPTHRRQAASRVSGDDRPRLRLADGCPFDSAAHAALPLSDYLLPLADQPRPPPRLTTPVQPSARGCARECGSTVSGGRMIGLSCAGRQAGAPIAEAAAS